MLYERSVVEFKLDFPALEEYLMATVQKFKLTKASSTDHGFMIKSHIANGYQEGKRFLFFVKTFVVDAYCFVSKRTNLRADSNG